MPINKPKLSTLVPSQLPEFIREDYTSFTAFMQAYYEFLRQNYDVDLLKIRDVDATMDAFVKFFKNEYTKDIPNLLLDDRFIIKHVKDYYLSKGSQVSFEIMMTVLFGKTMTVDYPARQMLRASDGKWNQDVSVFARINAGNPDMVVGRIVDVVTPQKVIRLQVNKTQNVEIEVDRVRQVVPGIYEFFVDRRFFGKISIGDRMRYADIFDATILATTAKVTINRPGKGFKVGELYDITNGQGTGSVLKVSRVNDTGGIIAAEFVRFGINYTTDFTATLIPNGAILQNNNAGATYLTIGGVEPNFSIGFGETTNGFTESGIVNKSDYNIQTPAEVIAEGFGLAWDGTYAGEVVREFYNDSKAPILDPEIPALIKIELGPLTKYPGYYTTNDGFLDDAIFIQDSRYYQAFSYVIKIDERLENYKSYAKTLLHPAGMALFGEYDIRNELDLSTSIECMLKYLVLTFQDNFLTTAEINAKDFGKYLYDHYLHDGVTQDNNTVSVPDFDIKTFGKTVNSSYLNDGTTLDDNTVTTSETINSKNFGKTVNSSVLNDGTTLDDNTVAAVDAGTIVSMSKPLTDSIVSTETINAKDFGKEINSSYLNDGTTLDNNTVTPTDASVLLTTKPLSDTVDTPTDSAVSLFSKVVNSSYLNDGTTLDNNTVIVTESNILDFSKALADTQSVSDSSVNAISKLLDSTHYLFDGVTVDTESFSVSDSSIILTTKYINDNVNDVAAPTDNGGNLWLNPYTDPYPVANSYFLNDGGDYTEGETTFTG